MLILLAISPIDVASTESCLDILDISCINGGAFNFVLGNSGPADSNPVSSDSSQIIEDRMSVDKKLISCSDPWHTTSPYN